MPIQTCFESSQELELYRQLVPSSDAWSLSFDDWINTAASPILSKSERLQIAQRHKKTILETERWLKTIETLREALVLNREQVSFCFSQLPSTQKNRALRDCFLFYLDSPLHQDRMSQVWSLVELLKSPKPETPSISSVDFVATEPSAYLFQELVKAASSRSSSVRLRAFSELGSRLALGRPVLKSANRVSCIEALCLQIKSFAKQAPDQKILLSFCGSHQSKLLVRSRLASLGFSVGVFGSSIQNSPSFWSLLLQSIRSARHLNSIEKTLLNSTLLGHPPFQSESLDSYKERLVTQGILNTSQWDALSPLELSDVERTEFSPPQVLLAPFGLLPALDGFTEFSFADESLLEPPTNETLFSETELDTLFFAGFQLPRWSESLSSRLNVLKYKSSALPERVFSSIHQDHLEGFHLISPERPVSSSQLQVSSTQASLPARALSATQLETYAECPSKYFYRRLKLHEVVISLSDFALNLGQSVHLTLETLFSSAEKPLLSEESLRNTFADCLTKTLSEKSNQAHLSLFYVKAFEKIIPRILEIEDSLNEHFGIRQTASVEKEFQIEIEGIPIVGKIDRIDRLNNNTLLVLDYKTGNVDFSPDHIAQGANFQALLYWLGAERAFSTAPAAMLFYDLKKGEVRRGLANEDWISPLAKKALTRGHTLKPEKLNDLLEAGKKAMKTFSDGIRSGHFSPTPSVEACRFCEAGGLCRRGVGYE